MSAAPNVSVIMSVYNSSEYLRQSIESILRQTYDDYEFIIINDGSRDDSAQIIEKYAIQDNRIKVVHQENAGLPTALNIAIKASKGRYIARMDADDISHPNRIKQQVAILASRPEVGVCHSLVELIDSKGMKIPLRNKVGFRYTANQTNWALIWRNCILHPTVMIRSDLLNSLSTCYDPKAIGCEDYKLWCRLKEKTQFVSIMRPLLKYRKHKESTTNNYDEKLLRCYSEIVSDNLKQGYNIHLNKDAARTLAIISGQAKLRGIRLNYSIDAYYFINLVKYVKSKYLEQRDADHRLVAEISKAISHQFYRWAKQTMFKHGKASIKFLSAAAIFSSKGVANFC